MLKLRRDLARALSLLELVARRERAKRELVRLTALIAERRYAAGDFANHLLPEPPPRFFFFLIWVKYIYLSPSRKNPSKVIFRPDIRCYPEWLSLLLWTFWANTEGTQPRGSGSRGAKIVKPRLGLLPGQRKNSPFWLTLIVCATEVYDFKIKSW